MMKQNRFIALWLLLCSFSFLLQAEMTGQANLQKPFDPNIILNSQPLSLDEVLDVEAEVHDSSSNQLDMNSLESLPTAPLMPLEPQFPLELTQANRQLLIDNPKRLEEAKASIHRYLEEHAFPWLAIVAVLGCGGLGWAIYLARDRWPKHPVKPIAVFSPQQQIHRDLQALQKSQLIEQGKIQIYYAGLVSILLSALQLRLGWKTKERTTGEVAQALKNSSQLTESQKQAIVAYLAEIDQIKFAGKQPSQIKAEQMSQHLQTFIQQII